MPITPDARADRLGRKTSAEVFQKLRAEVVSGSYAPGQFLPTERQLAVTHSVAQNTVRRALKALEAERLIVAEPRQGYRVLARVNDPLRGCPMAFVNWNAGPQDQWAGIDADLLSEMKSAADARGWSMLTMSAGSLSPSEVAERLSAARAFGVAMSTLDENTVKAIRALGLPTLMLDQWIEGAGTDSIMQDGHQAGLLAARHLVGQGCRRIAWFGPVDRYAHTAARFGGASAGLAGEGMPLAPELTFATPEGAEQHLAVARRMLGGPGRPEGVIALWGQNVAAAKRAADELGLVVGRDFRMVGWCREEAYAREYAPVFAGGAVAPVITWSVRTMAQTAVSRLAERREHPELPALQIKIPVRLRLAE
jgi:DNA-binding LacI/PurR family transcriptional regulator